MAENPEKFDPRDYLKPAREAAKKICRERYLQFGCEGQAAQDRCRAARQDRPPLRAGRARADRGVSAPAGDENAPLFESHLRSLPLIARGKVRDNYAVGSDRILMVASDRLSAFDVVMKEPIPGKGRVLTQMALFWFARLGHIVPNHLTGDDPESVVADDERAQVRGRAMLVKRLKPLPIEAVVRGYLAGSGWKEYQESGAVCGVLLPPGLKNASKLPAPIFTPATKAEMGDHDENIDFARASDIVGADLAAKMRAIAIRLYSEAAAFALARGIVIADTKFEFGLDDAGTLTLMDEVLTPDSSRFWPAASVVEGSNPPSLDKQPVRDWLEQVKVDGAPWNKKPPPPPLPRRGRRRDRGALSRSARRARLRQRAVSGAQNSAMLSLRR